MGRVVVVGSLNVDLVTRVERHPKPGETVVGSGLERRAGGKGANQAVAAAAAGAAVVMVGCVGSDEAGSAYVARLSALGIDVSGIRAQPDSVTGHALVTVDEAGENSIVIVAGANAAVTVGDLAVLDSVGPGDAVLLQLPLPAGLDEERALLAIDPEKDVDGLHPVNLGRLVMGAPGPLPCTPVGIIELLAAYDVPVEGRDVVIIGRGLTIGRPLALLMAMKRAGCNAAVTVVHTGVPNLAEHVARADIVIAAAGHPGIVTAEMVKSGAAVVSAGVSRDGKRIVPDVDESVGEVAGWITPRLGGVGPMTRAMLLRNTVLAAERRTAGTA